MDEEEKEDHGGDEFGVVLLSLFLDAQDDAPADVAYKDEDDWEDGQDAQLHVDDGYVAVLVAEVCVVVPVHEHWTGKVRAHEAVKRNNGICDKLDWTCYCENAADLGRPVDIKAGENNQHLQVIHEHLDEYT